MVTTFLFLVSVSILGMLFGAWLSCVAWMWKNQHRILYRNSGISDGHQDFQALFPCLTNGRMGSLKMVKGWVDNPGQKMALLYFGGSGEPIERRRNILAKNFPGHTRYLLSHRGSGPNHDLPGNEWDIKLDAECLFHLAKNKHHTVHIIGRSLGTSCALHLAKKEQVDGVVLITPFLSIADVAARRYRLLPVRKMLKDHHETWRDAKLVNSPILACIAKNDRVVRHNMWNQLSIHFGVPTTTHISKMDHETILEDHKTWSVISKWLLPKQAS